MSEHLLLRSTAL